MMYETKKADDVLLTSAKGFAVRFTEDKVRPMGRTAAELLFDRINGETAPPRRVVLPVRLIIRGSGELSPARDRG